MGAKRYNEDDYDSAVEYLTKAAEVGAQRPPNHEQLSPPPSIH